MSCGFWVVGCGWDVLLGAMVLTFCLVPLVRVYALKSGLVDEPGPRRSHQVPTPRGGGLAIVIAMAPAMILLPLPDFWTWSILPALAAIALLGFIDDHRPVPVGGRLLVQVVAGVWVLAWFGGVPRIGIADIEFHAPWLWTPLALVAIIWLINLYNFMDGSDGLAAGQGLLTSLFFALAFYLQGESAGCWFALAVAVVCLGFLPWNFATRRIFLGDVGSLSLGLSIGMLALVGASTGTVSVWLSLVLVSVFAVDTTATLVCKVYKGERWYTAHRQHAYQRLISVGWGHRAVLVGCVVINVGVVLPVGLLVLRYPHLDLVLSLLTCGLLLLGWFGIRRHTG